MEPLQYKDRPIISSVDGPADRISWLLKLVLVQLLGYVPAHLLNTCAFLENLLDTRLEELRDGGICCYFPVHQMTPHFSEKVNAGSLQSARGTTGPYHSIWDQHGSLNDARGGVSSV